MTDPQRGARDIYTYCDHGHHIPLPPPDDLLGDPSPFAGSDYITYCQKDAELVMSLYKLHYPDPLPWWKRLWRWLSRY